MYMYMYIYKLCSRKRTWTNSFYNICVSFSLRTKKVSIHGTEYRVNAVMHIGWEDEMPTFASILKLVIPESRRVYFVLKQYKTQQFDKH